MDLIDLIQSYSTQYQISSQPPKLNHLFPNFPLAQSPRFLNTQIHLSMQIKRFRNYTFLGKVRLINRDYIGLSLIHFDSKFKRLEGNNQRIKCMKKIIKKCEKQDGLILKLRFCDGQMILDNWLGFPYDYSKIGQDKLIQLLIDKFNRMSSQYEQIISQIQSELLNIKQDVRKRQSNNWELANQLKIFNKSSTHYTWNVMQGNTKSNKKSKNSVYQQKKAQFRKFRIQTKHNTFIKKVSSIHNLVIQQPTPLFTLKIDQDQQLKQSYLLNTKLINAKSKIINHINLSKQQKNSLKNSPIIKLLNGSDKLKLKLHKISSYFPQKYQKKVLQQLPQYQFSGIPKYFYSQQSEQNNQIILTNLIDVLNISDFLQKNSLSVTFSTKLLLLSQITNALRYLRDSNIVYHNLQPKNIMIKRGLVVKIIDFSNSFSNQAVNYFKNNQIKQLDDIMKQICRNQFPYIYNTMNFRIKTFDDQRSDSFSLAILIFQVLFKKTHINIKHSGLSKLTDNKMTQNLNNFVISIQRFKQLDEYIGRVIGNFLLNSLSHQMVQQVQLQLNYQGQLNLKARPYLDWFLIIIKHLSAWIQV